MRLKVIETLKSKYLLRWHTHHTLRHSTIWLVPIYTPSLPYLHRPVFSNEMRKLCFPSLVFFIFRRSGLLEFCFMVVYIMKQLFHWETNKSHRHWLFRSSWRSSFGCINLRQTNKQTKWGPFLESPGNFSGPWNHTSLRHELKHFVGLKDCRGETALESLKRVEKQWAKKSRDFTCYWLTRFPFHPLKLLR